MHAVVNAPCLSHPMVFYGVRGEDSHQLESPSFWNNHEASLVRLPLVSNRLHVVGDECWLRLSS